MKKKVKKLSLSAETIRNLADDKLDQAVGAASERKCTLTECTYTYACSGCQPCA